MEPLDKLIHQDEQLGHDAEDTAYGAVDDDTQVDEGLQLLHRVRGQRSEWPVDDPELKQIPGDLLWGPAAALPQTFGRFQIKRELGRGGFGIVLLAHDPKLQQDVALKIPRAETMLSPAARARLIREARAATILSHPAIVPLYELGELGAVPYISYGFCPGETLADWLATSKSPTPALAARIVSRLAEAVQHAHSRGIIHRDLKPSNVLLGEVVLNGAEGSVDNRSDEATVASAGEHAMSLGEPKQEAFVGRLRIADFGFAKMESGRSDISQTGIPLGTPAYMSPEQARGDARVGPASDIFSLGIILYELLMGQTPFRRETQVATLRAVESDVHVSIPSHVVSRDLSAICDKCLQKRPQDRYANAQSLQSDLQRFLRDEPVQARTISGPARLVRWCRRNRALAAAVLLAVSSMIVGTVVSVNFGLRAQRHAADAARYAGHSSRAVEGLLTALANEPSVRGAPMESFRSKLHASALEFYEAVHKERPEDLEQSKQLYKTLSSLAKIQGMLGHNAQAAKMYAEAAELAATMPPSSKMRRAYATAKRNQSRQVAATGRHQEAVTIAEEGLAALDKDSGDKGELNSLMQSLTEVAYALLHQGETQRAAQTIDQALDVGQTWVGRAPLGWPAAEYDNTFIALAKTLRTKVEIANQLDQHEALPELALATIQLFEQIRENEPIHQLMCLDSISSMYFALANRHYDREEWDRAEQFLRQRMEVDQAMIDLKPNLGIIRSNWLNAAHRLAQVLDQQQRTAEAQELTNALLASAMSLQDEFPETYPWFHLREVDLRILRAGLYEQRGDQAESTAELHEALGISQELAEADHPLPYVMQQLQSIQSALQGLKN